jgi:hypothetical protein
VPCPRRLDLRGYSDDAMTMSTAGLFIAYSSSQTAQVAGHPGPQAFAHFSVVLNHIRATEGYSSYTQT